MLRYMTDRARPGLAAFHDIRPGNTAGLFLQPGTRTGWRVNKYITQLTLYVARPLSTQQSTC